MRIDILTKIQNKHREILICLLLVTVTTGVYWKTGGYDYVNLDDNEYVYDNPYVNHGVTTKNLIWAFTAFHSNNWHPLTWISHMAVCQFYGIKPGPQHLTNLFFHVINTLLLFFVFRIMTSEVWKSGFIAALFALHPLHVESVAWISERKDVLSAFFWMLTMWSYVRYVKHPIAHRYISVILFFIFGLMSKPMVVTLPFILLLLDYWPLNRFQSSPVSIIKKGGATFRLVLEKAPLFFLMAMSCFLTYCAQKKGGVLKSLEIFPFQLRLANATVSYVKYIGKMIYPTHLAGLYPYPRFFSWWEICGAGLILGLISFFAVKMMKKRPYLIVGWLWYLGTLVPVIGLIQVGMQPMADRYTYIPLIGLFVMIAWGIPNLLVQWQYGKIFLATSAIIIILAFSGITSRQVTYWKDNITIYERDLQVTSDNYIVHNSLGSVLKEQGRVQEAIQNYRYAIRINPDFAEAHCNLGDALVDQGRAQEAIQEYLYAIRIKPNFAEAYNNLGNALKDQGRVQEAIQNYRCAIRIDPDFAKAYNNLGNVLLHQGNTQEAIQNYRNAIQINPNFAEAYNNLGNALLGQGHIQEAIRLYLQALEIKPDYVEARYDLGVAFFNKGDIDKSIGCFHEALRLNPDNHNIQNTLNKVLAIQKQNR